MAAEYHASAFVERTFLRQGLATTLKADLKNLWSGSDLPAAQKGEQDPAADHNPTSLPL
jgi:hypothetical protein